jgi:Integrase core domain
MGFYFGTPWQNAYVERVIGSIRRECLDYIVIFNERHLRRVLSTYIDYYHRTRTHLSLDKDCPDPRPVMPASGRVVAIRKSMASITDTNVSPPDSSRLLLPILLCAAGTPVPEVSLIGGFRSRIRLRPYLRHIRFESQPVSIPRFNSTSVLAADQIPLRAAFFDSDSQKKLAK